MFLPRYYPADIVCSVHAMDEDIDSKHRLGLLSQTSLLKSEEIFT